MATYIKNNPLKLLLSLLVVLTIIISSGWPPAWALTSEDDTANVPLCVDCRHHPCQCPPFIDSDGDGLSDELELSIGTDPYNVDSDGDGRSDKNEYDGNFNPLNNNSPVNTTDNGINPFKNSPIISVSEAYYSFEGMNAKESKVSESTTLPYYNIDHTNLDSSYTYTTTLEEPGRFLFPNEGVFLQRKEIKDESISNTDLAIWKVGSEADIGSFTIEATPYDMPICGWFRVKYGILPGDINLDDGSRVYPEGGRDNYVGVLNFVADIVMDIDLNNTIDQNDQINENTSQNKILTLDQAYQTPVAAPFLLMTPKDFEDSANDGFEGEGIFANFGGTNVYTSKTMSETSLLKVDENGWTEDPIDFAENAYKKFYISFDGISSISLSCQLKRSWKKKLPITQQIADSDGNIPTEDGYARFELLSNIDEINIGTKSAEPCEHCGKKPACPPCPVEYKINGEIVTCLEKICTHVHCENPNCLKPSPCAKCTDKTCAKFIANIPHLVCECDGNTTCGDEVIKVNSMHFYFKLGQLTKNVLSGQLFVDIDEDNFSPDIYTPKLLKYRSSSKDLDKGVVETEELPTTSLSGGFDIETSLIDGQPTIKTFINADDMIVSVDNYPSQQCYYLVFSKANNGELVIAPTRDDNGHITNISEHESYWKIENPDFNAELDLANQANERLMLTHFQKGIEIDTYVFSYKGSPKVWGLSHGPDSEEIEYLTKLEDENKPGERVEIREQVKKQKNGQEITSSIVQEEYYNNVIRKKIVAPGSLNLITLYSDAAAQGLNPPGKLMPYGDWLYIAGNTPYYKEKYSCWLDNSISEAPNGREDLPTVYKLSIEDATIFDKEEDSDQEFRKMETRVTTNSVAGITMSQEFTTYKGGQSPPETSALHAEEEVITEISLDGSPYGSTNNMQTKKVYHPDYLDKGLSPDRLRAIREYYIIMAMDVDLMNEYQLEKYQEYTSTNYIPDMSYVPFDNPDNIPDNILYGGGKIKEITNPDGTISTYEYSENTETITYTSVDHPNGIVGKSKRIIKKYREYDNKIVSKDVQIKMGSTGYAPMDYRTISYSSYKYDDNNKLERVDTNNTFTESKYGSNCCGKESQSDSYGRNYSYIYNGAKRLKEKRIYGAPFGSDLTVNRVPETTEIYSYDGSGRVTKKLLASKDYDPTASDNSAELIPLQTTEYDLAGRVRSQTDQNGVEAVYTYTKSAKGGLVQTMTKAGVVEAVEYYCDGQVKTVTRNNGVNEYHRYTPTNTSEGGRIVHTTYYGEGNSNDGVWTKVYKDGLGRVTKVEENGRTATSVILSEKNYYNSKGQLYKQESDFGPTVLYEYDSLGNMVRSGKDVDEDDQLTIDSLDVINEVDVTYIEGDDYAQIIWKVTEKATYNDDNLRVVTSTTKEQMTNLGTTIVSNTFVTDHMGNETQYLTTIEDQDSSEEGYEPVVRESVISPATDQITEQVKVGGKLIESINNGIVTKYYYDKFSRLYQVVDARTGTTTYAYDNDGYIGSITTALGTVSYFYDAFGNCEKQIDANNKVSYYSYTPTGKLHRAWGQDNAVSPYPVEFKYDDFGRMEEMQTFRTGDFLTETWPEGAVGQKTIWDFNDQGLLRHKLDAQNNRTRYYYNPLKRVANEIWDSLDEPSGSTFRSTKYDPITGQVNEVQNFDGSGTGSQIWDMVVKYTFNRLGQVKNITDAVGTRTFTYNDNLTLNEEIIGDVLNEDGTVKREALYKKTITRDYEQGFSGEGSVKYNGFTMGDYQLSYGLDTAGRINNVTSPAGSFTYGYLENSNLVNYLLYPNQKYTNTDYEPNRNLVKSVENKYNSTTVSKFEYNNNATGRRENMITSGSAFENSTFIKYGYNDRSEVTSAQRYFGTDVNNLGSPDSSYTYGFQFDNIGNRESSSSSSDSKTYIPDPSGLNQYAEIVEHENGQSTSATKSLAYSQAGCMLNDGSWEYDWIGGYVLKSASKGSTKVDFIYDYMGRLASMTKNNISAEVPGIGKPSHTKTNSMEYIYYLKTIDNSQLTYGGVATMTAYSVANSNQTELTINLNTNTGGSGGEGEFGSFGTFSVSSFSSGIAESPEFIEHMKIDIYAKTDLNSPWSNTPYIAGVDTWDGDKTFTITDSNNDKYCYFMFKVNCSGFQGADYDLADGGTSGWMETFDFSERNETYIEPVSVSKVETQFIYNGWNLIEQIDVYPEAERSLSKYYTWGLDIASSTTATGGVGALLAQSSPSTLDPSILEHFYPNYDAQGNVSEYIDEANNIVAHYEYSPFGKVVKSEGEKASDFDFKYSTKYQISVTNESSASTLNLFYYGYRFYHPELGRWLNRDPIQEQGGLNLYGMVNNNAVNFVDYLGLSELDSDIYRAKILERLRAGERELDELWRASLKDYWDADPEGDWICDCEDDMEEIMQAFYEAFGHDKINGEENSHYHRNDITVGGMLPQGTGFASHFFAGAEFEGAFEMGDTAQLVHEAIQLVTSSQGSDFGSDTAYAFMGADTSDLLDTFFETSCREIVKKFLSGEVKMSDLIDMDPIGNDLPDIKKSRLKFRANLKYWFGDLY